MIRGRIFLCLTLSCLCVSLTHSQESPLKGVVWDAATPPTAEDLFAIREAGVEAVRLPMVEDLSLLYVADTLGLHLFQDLPVHFLSGGALLDTLAYAKRHLLRAREFFRLFPSAHRYGVSTFGDTSNPHACEYYRELAEFTPELTLYYTSAFIVSDQCSSHVDLMLVDLRQASDSIEPLSDWDHQTPLGIASLGQKVDPEVFGLRQRFSPESQARFLENHLPGLLKGPFPVVFVYRWQDANDTFSWWGLLDASGEKRPAFEVVRGIYTGTQNLFAFDSGEWQRSPAPWPLILGWTSCVLIAILIMAYGRLPEVMWNYILNLYPHQDTLYRESALLGEISFVYTIAQGVLISAVILILLEVPRDLLMMEAISSFFPSGLSSLTHTLTSNTWFVIFFVIGSYVGFQFIYSLVGASRAQQPVEPFFVINAMTNTPQLLMLPMVMITPNLSEVNAIRLSVILALTWILLSVFCNIRSTQKFSFLDRRNLTKGGFFWTYAIYFLPISMILLTLLIPQTREQIVFWWHLSFRG